MILPSLPERVVPGHGGIGIDFVGVPRDWLAGVKRAEVETAVALPGSGSFDHAMPIVEVVISPSKAGHECSRSVDASRAALRRPEVREQIELFWSQAPPVPSELSVDEHAGLLAKAAGVAWRRAAPRVQAAPQADWMDEEAWQAVRAHAVARRAHQKASQFLSRAWLKTFFAQWRHAVRPDSEQRRQELLWDVEGLARLNLQIAWCRYGMDAQAKAARDATWQAKQRWMEGQADSMARLQETGDWAATWSAVRKLVGRKKRSFRPPVPMIGDDGRPLASLQAKANQHQRELMKEFGENCAEFSEAEHLVKVQADKQAAPVLLHQVADGHVCIARHGARMGGCSSRSFQAQVRSCFWARRYPL